MRRSTAWLTTAAIGVVLAAPAANAAQAEPLDASSTAPPGGPHPPRGPGPGPWPGRPPGHEGGDRHPGGGDRYPGGGDRYPGGGDRFPGGGDRYPGPSENPVDQRPVDQRPAEPPADRSPSSGSTTTCLPDQGSCTVTPIAGPDSRFSITASGGHRTTELFGTLNGGSRPSCPDYRARNSDWVQFGFRDGASGSSWDKTVSLTTRHGLAQRDALELADQMQICFEAPYAFATRDGYHLGRHGGSYDGVLPACGRSSETNPANPCVAEIETIPLDGSWVVRFTFRVPANSQDPKALG